MSDSQIALVGAGHLHRVNLPAQFLKQHPESPHLHLIPGQFSGFQPLPMLAVNHMVACQHLVFRHNTKAFQGFSQSNPLCLVEIQDGIIQVKKKKFHHWLSLRR